MASKSKTTATKREPIKKRTSIGNSTRSKNKKKRATRKKYRGQGRP